MWTWIYSISATVVSLGAFYILMAERYIHKKYDTMKTMAYLIQTAVEMGPVVHMSALQYPSFTL